MWSRTRMTRSKRSLLVTTHDRWNHCHAQHYDTMFSISTKDLSFGCFWIQSPHTIDLTNAPDIREILGLERRAVILSASFYVSNVIDITRNRQVIQVYSSLVWSFDLKIANQNNNLLNTMIINDLTTIYCRSVEDICIPMITRFDRLMFLCLRFGRQYHAIEQRIRTPIDHYVHVWSSAFIDSTDEPVQYDRSVR